MKYYRNFVSYKSNLDTIHEMVVETIKAKKQFGQNFLHDEAVLRQIIEAIPKTNTKKIVEIGPGLGDLTTHLLNFNNVEAFEVDTDLCEHLGVRFKNELESSSFALNCGDVLQSWKRQNLVGYKYNLVANLPYYIATNIILLALADEHCEALTVMVQKEVAEKFAASPNTKPFSALSVIAQSAGEVDMVFVVPPEAFNPAPKVDSAVLRIVKNKNCCDEKFKAMLRIAFTHPRKTLQKNLSSHYEKAKVIDAIKALDLSETVRPHQVDVTNYHRLYMLFEGSTDGFTREQ